MGYCGLQVVRVYSIVWQDDGPGGRFGLRSTNPVQRFRMRGEREQCVTPSHSSYKFGFTKKLGLKPRPSRTALHYFI
ncbi:MULTISPECIES: hypothetical protein [Nostocales]|uniref:Uncharacterized protein n=3 Tax=Nostocales TaxID=1161 RepID=A0A8S9STJ7_9CYAN|nr:hypothetical protein [Tolypothrix bouteillei]KAF3883830.1 hypothetical protein DA73_0400039665 [Tolypothrix bouteillei VB521301]